MWDYDAKKLQQLIEENPDPTISSENIRFRPMFGGILAYTHDRPLASLSNAGLALKLADADRDALIEQAGGYPLRYKPDDPPSKGYTVLPKDMIEERGERLNHWLNTSIQHCKILPLKKKKPLR